MKKSKKILLFFLIIMSYIIISLICCNKTYAVTQTISTDINSINTNKYPQIKELIQGLKKAHPNWNFKILYTGLDWNEVIANEYVGHGRSPRSLVQANNSKYSGDWICSICGDETYDTGKWHCASEGAIAYMLDARNSINSSDIFQFLELSYTDYNIETIRKMVSGTFLNQESYINTIVNTAKKYNVNAYYIVAKILQEQKPGGTPLTKGEGHNGQYIGYYNVFNLGTSGSGNDNVIYAGLKYAKEHRWTSIELSIEGGAQIIAEKYISKGQNTLYLQKFDVDASDGKLYWHQYSQNILAAQSEGTRIRTTYTNMGALDGEYTFIIPVYENMPATASIRPATKSSDTPESTDIVRVNVEKSLRLRNQPNGSETVGWVYTDETLTRLEKATTKVGGTYWDYVMKANGTKGYAARETYESESTYKLYLVPVNQNPTPDPTPEPTPEPEPEENIIKNETIKIDKSTNTILAILGATGNNIIDLMKTEITVKNNKGENLLPTDTLLTGYNIDDKYTISVLGDVNGDGTIDSGDLLAIQKDLLNAKKLNTKAKQLSADVNQDGIIDSGDLLKIKKQLLGVSKIEIK